MPSGRKKFDYFIGRGFPEIKTTLRPLATLDTALPAADAIYE